MIGWIADVRITDKRIADCRAHCFYPGGPCLWTPHWRPRQARQAVRHHHVQPAKRPPPKDEALLRGRWCCPLSWAYE
eukprot:9257132-Alexandrium_andersonii.AAC.1